MQSGVCAVMATGGARSRLNEVVLMFGVLGPFETIFTHNLCISIEGSEVQRSPSISVRVVDDRTFLHQKLHNVLLSF